jgi:hypothetical protein
MIITFEDMCSLPYTIPLWCSHFRGVSEMYLELWFAELQHRWNLHIFLEGQCTSTHHRRLNAAPTNCSQGRNNMYRPGCHLTMIRYVWSLHLKDKVYMHSGGFTDWNLEFFFYKSLNIKFKVCHRICCIGMESMCCLKYLLHGPF